MTDIAGDVRDKSLELAKTKYLRDMRTFRSEYARSRDGAEINYEGSCRATWAKFWEDVG